jgi:hypothetical protein
MMTNLARVCIDTFAHINSTAVASVVITDAMKVELLELLVEAADDRKALVLKAILNDHLQYLRARKLFDALRE